MKRQFLLLASLRFLKISLTVAILILYARAFGIGIQMDSWVFSSGIVASVGLALWGPVNEVVRPRFLHQVAQEGEESARSSATSLLIFTSVTSVILCVLLFVFAPNIINALSAQSEYSLILKLFVLMIPSIALGQFLCLGTAYMNCCNIIYLPEFMGIIAAVVNLISVFVFAPFLGAYSLALGYYLGSFLSLIVILHFLKSHRFLQKVPAGKRLLKEVTAVFIFAAPLFLSYAAGQTNSVFEKYLASFMGIGAISSINYASQIKSTLQAVLTSVLFSLTLPRLTHSASQGTREKFKNTLSESQQIAMIFLLLVLPLAFGTADVLTKILFDRAPIAIAPQEMTLLIRFYVVALVPVVLYLVYGSALLAQQKGKDYALLGVSAQLFSALICWFFYRRLGAIVFPLALFFSHIVVALLMLKRIDLANRYALLGEAIVSITIIVIFSIAVMWAYHAIGYWISSLWFSLFILGLIYGLIIFVMLYLNPLANIGINVFSWVKSG